MLRCFIGFIFLCVSLQTFGQSDPVTRIKNQGAGGYKVSPNLLVPFNQSTKLTSITNRIETGNKEILSNHSFEGGVVGYGWTLAGATGALTSTAIEGNSGYELTLTGLLSLTQESALLTVAKAEGNQGIIAGAWIKSSLLDVQLCLTGNASAELKCVAYTGAGEWRYVEARGVFNDSLVGIKVKTTASTTGTIIVDDASLSEVDIKEQQLLAATQSSGVIEGCTINATSIGKNSVDLDACKVRIVDNYTDPLNPTVVIHDLAAQSVALPNIATQDSTVLNIDAAGVISAIDVSAPTTIAQRDIVFLGGVSHVNRTSVQGISNNSFTVGHDLGLALADWRSVFGSVNSEGNIITSPSGLTLDKTDGKVFAFGINYKTDRKEQNFDSLEPCGVNSGTPPVPCSWIYTYRNGAGDWTDVAGVTSTNPAQYDDGTGTLASVPNNGYKVDRLYVVGDILVMQYGQALYSTLAGAISGATSESVEVNPVLKNGTLLGWIIGKGNDTTIPSGQILIARPNTTAAASGSVTYNVFTALPINSAGNPNNITTCNNIVLADASAAPVTATLPNSAASNANCTNQFYLYNNTNSLTVTTTGGTQLIGDSTSQVVSALNTGFTAFSYPDEPKYIITQDSRGKAVSVDHTLEGDGSGSAPLSVANKGTDNNLVENGNFTVDATGWAASSANITVARNTTAPMFGAGDGLITITSAATTSDYVQYGPISLDSGDQAGVMKLLSLKYKTGGDYDDDDIGLYLWDGSKLVYPADQALKATTGNSTSRYFQIDTGVTQVWVRFKVDAVPASNATVTIDNVFLGEKAKVTGSPYIYLGELPTTGSWTTNTTYTGKYWRNGDYLKAEIEVDLAGAPNATNLLINYPVGYTPDTAKMNAVQFLTSLDGEVKLLDSSASNRIDGRLIYDTTTYARVTSFLVTGTRIKTDTTSNANPFTFAAGDKVIIKYKIPIVGWSSNMVLSEDAGNRSLWVDAAGNGGGSVSGSVDIDWTEIEDRSNSWSGTIFTPPETGEYLFNGSMAIAGSAEVAINMYKSDNGGPFVYYRSLSRVTSSIHAFNSQVSLKSTDRISFRPNTSVTLTNNTGSHHLTIEKIASPQTIAASEVQSGFADTNGAANGNIPTATYEQIIFDDVISDTHNALNTSNGELAAKRNGKLSLDASYRFNSHGWSEGEPAEIRVLVNGTPIKRLFYEIPASGGGTNVFVALDISITGYPVAFGDVITVDCYQNTGSTLTLISDATNTTIGWEIK